MIDDQQLPLREVMPEDDDEPLGEGRRPLAGREPQVHLTIAGISGETVQLSLNRSEIEGRDLDAEGLLRLAIDHGHDDFDGTPEELARRRAFLHGLPGQIAAAGGGLGSQYIIMMEDSETGTRAVHPQAPISLGSAETAGQDLHAQFTVAPYHVGG